MSKKVLVLSEVREGTLRNVSFEAIASAKTIADGGEVVGVLIGDAVETLSAELIQYGADRTVTVEHPHLKQYYIPGIQKNLHSKADHRGSGLPEEESKY